MRKAMPVALLFTSPEMLAKATRAPPKLSLPRRGDDAAAPRKVGDRVVFSHDKGTAEGEIVGKTGEHGAHVRSDEGEVRQVLWSAMGDGPAAAAEPPPEDQVDKPDAPAD